MSYQQLTPFEIFSIYEKKRLAQQLKRAARAGCPATLTIEQWYETVSFFDFKCAYCEQPGSYEVMDHFIPLPIAESRGQECGTTIGNCVPCCYSCNSIKRDIHPQDMTDDTSEDGLQPWVMRVSQQLVFLKLIRNPKSATDRAYAEPMAELFDRAAFLARNTEVAK